MADVATEKRIEIERRKEDAPAFLNTTLCVLILAVFVTSCFVLQILDAEESIQRTIGTIGLAATAYGYLVSALGYSAVAREEGQLPVRLGGPPKHNHISGIGVFLVSMLLLSMFFLIRNATAAGESFNITEIWGHVTISMIFLLCLAVIFGPKIARSSAAPSFKNLIKRVSPIFFPIGRVFSVLDSWLVFIVAPIVGVTYYRDGLRYGALMTQLVPLIVLGWVLPTPLGLVPIVWSFVLVIAVARRWAWSEEDREIAMINADFESDQLRVGFKQDLKDEALFGYLSLLLTVPFAMRQIHELGASFDTEVFRMTSTALHDPSSWIGYFGTELAKAVPFVDWTEVYGIKGKADISESSNWAKHVVFGARVIVDLVFIAALIQVISIMSRTSKQKKLFEDDESQLDHLDPFIEGPTLISLTKREADKFVLDEAAIKSFPVYSEARLRSLHLTTSPGTRIGMVVRALSEKQGLSFDAPHEQLTQQVLRPNPDRLAIVAALKLVRDEQDFDLDSLEECRQHLNGIREFNSVRKEIATMVASFPPSDEVLNVLAGILNGEQEADSIAEVRVIAIEPLFKAAQNQSDFARSQLRTAEESDRAVSVRAAASNALSHLTELEPT